MSKVFCTIQQNSFRHRLLTAPFTVPFVIPFQAIQHALYCMRHVITSGSNTFYAQSEDGLTCLTSRRVRNQ